MKNISSCWCTFLLYLTDLKYVCTMLRNKVLLVWLFVTQLHRNKIQGKNRWNGGNQSFRFLSFKTSDEGLIQSHQKYCFCCLSIIIFFSKTLMISENYSRPQSSSRLPPIFFSHNHLQLWLPITVFLKTRCQLYVIFISEYLKQWL